jgi:serine/threonine protein kinase
VPDRLSYDEAVRLSEVRLKVQDPDLKKGRVEMITINAYSGSFERPWGLQGGFAVVYKFRTQSNKPRALRCFISPINADTQFRYERIDSYFHKHIPDITAGFRYHNPGIAVKEQGRPQPTLCPLIEMEWIEGKTLLDEVDELCARRDRARLKQLCQQWLDILQKMRQAQIAHGDLAAVNVMVRSDGRLVLIDYDGVYIPEFAGMRQVLVGQADYQHPQMSNRPFTERMDDFSALVIYTALLASSIRPELWDKYMKRDPQQGKLLDTNFLFTAQDFKAPAQSPLMQELLHFQDQQVRDVAQELARACLQPIEQVRFPLHLVDPDYEKKQALNRLRIALQNRDIMAIAAGYTPGHAFFQALTPAEQQEAQAMHTFVQVCTGNDDNAIIAAYNALQNLPNGRLLVLPSQYQQSVALAQKRVEALSAFRAALASKNLREVVNAYQPILDGSTALTQEEREQLTLSQDFIRAYDVNDDDALIATQHALLSSPYHAAFVFTTEEQQHVATAEQRKHTLLKFRHALQQQRPDKIIAAYSQLLDNSKHVTQHERQQLKFARSFVQAYTNDDDDALIVLDKELPKLHIAFALTQQERERIELAHRRFPALEKFRHAWQTNIQRADHLLAAYDASLLDACNSVTQEQRTRLADARNYLKMYQEVLAGIHNDNDDAIRQAFNKQLDRSFIAFTEAQRHRITKAVQVLDVKGLLDNKEYEQAIRLVKNFIVSTRQEINDFLKPALHKATMRFIRQHDVTDVQVQIEEDERGGINYAKVYWHWPANDLVQDALIAWRTDTWPQRPRERNWQDPQCRHVEVRRNRLDSEGVCCFSIECHTHVYVQIFTCILDEWEHEQRQWRYSDGVEPSSRCEVGSDRITWKTCS